MNERFKTDLLLYKRNIQDDNQMTIKDLNDELSQLKDKMKYVYEKDKQIKVLKSEILELKGIIEVYADYKNKLQSIVRRVKQIEKERDDLQLENNKLKSIISKLNEQYEKDNIEEDRIKQIIIKHMLEKEKGKLEGKLELVDIDPSNIEDILDKII
tara:strand:+ start:7 stop:474 length:468 start_codon:yes stop_codon:yes gene_type:complete